MFGFSFLFSSFFIVYSLSFHVAFGTCALLSVFYCHFLSFVSFSFSRSVINFDRFVLQVFLYTLTSISKFLRPTFVLFYYLSCTFDASQRSHLCFLLVECLSPCIVLIIIALAQIYVYFHLKPTFYHLYIFFCSLFTFIHFSLFSPLNHLPYLAITMCLSFCLFRVPCNFLFKFSSLF